MHCKDRSRDRARFCGCDERGNLVDDWPRVVPRHSREHLVAAAAAFLSQHYAPVILLALLLGMAMNFLSDVNRRIPCLIYINASARWLGLAW